MMLTTSSISHFRLSLQQDSAELLTLTLTLTLTVTLTVTLTLTLIGWQDIAELRESFRIFDRDSHGYLTWQDPNPNPTPNPN